MSTYDTGSENDNLSPTEFLALEFFPLSHSQLAKVCDCHIKILDELQKVIENIQARTKTPPRVESPEEHTKLTKRANEFSTRFSRNHLYPLRTETRQVAIAVNSSKLREKGKRNALNVKLNKVYQSALQAVQAFVVYSSQRKNLKVNQKLEEMIEILQELHSKTKNLLIPAVGDKYLTLLPALCEKILEEVKKPVEVPAILLPKPVKKKKPRNLNVATGLSMYEPKLSNWSINAQSLARLQLAQKAAARKKKAPSSTVSRAPSKTSIAQTGRKEIPAKKHMRAVKTERKIDRVEVEQEIETEVQRHNPPQVGHMPPEEEMRVMMKEALQYLEMGEKENAFKKLQAMSARQTDVIGEKTTRISKKTQKIEEIPRNIGHFTFYSETQKVSDTPDQETPKESNNLSPEINHQQDILTNSIVLPDNKIDEKCQDIYWPFQSKQQRNKGLIELNVSPAVMKTWKRIKKQNARVLKKYGERKPWDIIGTLSEEILDDMLGEILEDEVSFRDIDDLINDEFKICD